MHQSLQPLQANQALNYVHKQEQQQKLRQNFRGVKKTTQLKQKEPKNSLELVNGILRSSAYFIDIHLSEF